MKPEIQPFDLKLKDVRTHPSGAAAAVTFVKRLVCAEI